MNRLLKPFLKLPDTLSDFRISLNKNKYDSVNLYFQDESRFGLMTHTGRCLTSMGTKPIVKYRHAFKNTYLYGAFSPLDGNYFIYEIQGVSSEIFFKYIQRLSEHRPNELMIVFIDNAGFHSLKQFKNQIPDNIRLIRIPPYSPELNPSEKMWAYIKKYYKNLFFETIGDVKQWLADFVNNKIDEQIVKSITHNEKFLNVFNAQFMV
jgi:transposase